MDLKSYTKQYLSETIEIARAIDIDAVVSSAEIIGGLKQSGGRLFILGVGGSAANASHAVNDFRKLAGIEAYTPADNVSELTARTNDEGWNTVFHKWLEISKLGEKDVLMIFSVGGGSPSVSANITEAIDYAVLKKAKIIAIVSRDGGHAKEKAHACVLIPVIDKERITPHAEGWQAVLWHLIVNAILFG